MSTFFNDVEKIWSGAKIDFKIDQSSNFGEIILNKLADADSDRVMQIDGDTGESITKAEIRRRTIRCAQNLRHLGCTLNKRIVIVSRNHQNLTPLLFAAFCNGSPISALDTDAASVKEGASLILQRIEPTFIFCDADVLLSVKKILMFMFTNRVDRIGFTMLCFSSLYWLSGIIMTVTSAFKNTRLFTSQLFSTDLFFDLVEKYKVQFFGGPPCQVQAFLKSERCKSANLSSLIMSLSLGSNVPSILIDTMKEIIPHCMFMTSYGMTETGGSISMPQPKELEECPNTVGRLISGVRVKIVNTTTKDKCGIEEEGEICVKMPIPVMGYLRDESANQNSYDKDGYFVTGDVGYFDESGRLFISGRKKETFKNRGFSIWPAEIEDVIQKCPAVCYASVVNVYDDEIMSDLIAAVVVKNDQNSITAQEIYSLVADQLASYKRLDGGVYFVDELPMTSSGKIIRSKVNEIAQEFYRNKNQMK